MGLGMPGFARSTAPTPRTTHPRACSGTPSNPDGSPHEDGEGPRFERQASSVGMRAERHLVPRDAEK